jgi:hypothetical protein
VSEDKPQSSLRFSLGFLAIQFLILGGFGVASTYLAQRYWFHFDQILAEPGSRRYAWLDSIANTNDGKTDAVLWTAFALLLGWYAGVAAWRFCTAGKAAMLTGRELLLHWSIRRKGEIPFADVLSAEVGVSPSSGLFIKRHDLHIEFRDRKAVRLRALETEGGVEALKAFAKELNKRRKLAAASNP